AQFGGAATRPQTADPALVPGRGAGWGLPTGVWLKVRELTFPFVST
ncbi:unnamed protein product, partial [Urochloa humidicola]